MQLTVTQLTDRLVASYARVGGINHLDGKNLPSKHAIADITVDLLRLLFPGFFDGKLIHSSEIKVETATLLDSASATVTMRHCAGLSSLGVLGRRRGKGICRFSILSAFRLCERVDRCKATILSS